MNESSLPSHYCKVYPTPHIPLSMIPRRTSLLYCFPDSQPWISYSDSTHQSASLSPPIYPTHNWSLLHFVLLTFFSAALIPLSPITPFNSLFFGNCTPPPIMIFKIPDTIKCAPRKLMTKMVPCYTFLNIHRGTRVIMA